MICHLSGIERNAHVAQQAIHLSDLVTRLLLETLHLLLCHARMHLPPVNATSAAGCGYACLPLLLPCWPLINL